MKQFLAFLKKEFYHILRDVRTMLMLIAMPIVLIILFGFAITTEIKEAPIAVLNHSMNEKSRQIVEELEASEYFKLYSYVDSKKEIEQLFLQDKVRIAIIFNSEFNGINDNNIQILSDASNPNNAVALTQYAKAIISPLFGNQSKGNIRAGTIEAVPHLLYNPQMKGSYNFVPGVMGLILILICAMMTSIGVVKEREIGTMEVLLVSPLRPSVIIISKMIPYLVISMVNIATILLLSRFLLDVPIRGSLFLLLFITIIYSWVALMLGLLISTVVDSQQSAMLVSGVALMLPVILLSGMMFPIENMPYILQVISNVVPTRWYISAIRDVMIKGLEWDYVIKEIGILVLMGTFITVVSVKRFKIRL